MTILLGGTDDLGNHTATQDLAMAGYDVTGAGALRMGSGGLVDFDGAYEIDFTSGAFAFKKTGVGTVATISGSTGAASFGTLTNANTYITILADPTSSSSGILFNDGSSDGQIIYGHGSHAMIFKAAVATVCTMDTNGVEVVKNLRIGASNATLEAPSANTLELRNGTNPQSFYIYNTYTDASNYERAELTWASDILEIGTAAAGTGSPQPLRMKGANAAAADPTTTEFPNDKDWGVHKNTSSGDVFLAFNDGGAIKKVQLT